MSSKLSSKHRQRQSSKATNIKRQQKGAHQASLTVKRISSTQDLVKFENQEIARSPVKHKPGKKDMPGILLGGGYSSTNQKPMFVYQKQSTQMDHRRAKHYGALHITQSPTITGKSKGQCLVQETHSIEVQGRNNNGFITKKIPKQALKIGSVEGKNHAQIINQGPKRHGPNEPRQSDVQVYRILERNGDNISIQKSGYVQEFRGIAGSQLRVKPNQLLNESLLPKTADNYQFPPQIEFKTNHVQPTSNQCRKLVPLPVTQNPNHTTLHNYSDYNKHPTFNQKHNSVRQALAGQNPYLPQQLTRNEYNHYSEQQSKDEEVFINNGRKITGLEHQVKGKAEVMKYQVQLVNGQTIYQNLVKAAQPQQQIQHVPKGFKQSVGIHKFNTPGPHPSKKLQSMHAQVSEAGVPLQTNQFFSSQFNNLNYQSQKMKNSQQTSFNKLPLKMMEKETLIIGNGHEQIFNAQHIQKMQSSRNYDRGQTQAIEYDPNLVQNQNYVIQNQGFTALPSNHMGLLGVRNENTAFHLAGQDIQSIYLPQFSHLEIEKQTLSAKKQTDLYGKPISQEKKNKIPFENAYVQDCYKYIVTQGNNAQLIRKAMERRTWWIEIQPVHSMFNFKWQPCSHGIKYERLGGVQAKSENNISFNTTLGGTNQQLQSNVISKEPLKLSAINSRQMVNHYEHHQLITEKFNLLQQLQKHADIQKENVFDMTPITFYVEMPNVTKEAAYNSAMLPFTQYFQALDDNKQVMREIKDELSKKEQEREFIQQDEQEQVVINTEDDQGDNGSPVPNKEKLESSAKKEQGLLSNVAGFGTLYKTQGKDLHRQSTKFKQFNFEKRTFTKYSCPLSHFDGYNLWLLKPTHLNRGRGIHVFNDLPTLHKLIKEYCSGKDEEGWKKKDQDHKKDENKDDQIEDEDEEDSPEKWKQSASKKSKLFKIKHNAFVIQKYIERPLLICNRKFDFRVWVLLDQDQNLYLFKEGYIRTSSSEFSIDLQNVDNAAVHLTNNSVQKALDNYGKFEDGNQMSYKRFQEVLVQEQPDCGIDIYKHIVPQMKQLIIKTISAVRKTIDPNKRKFTFELFGYDFITDEDFNTWLIEVNTNPCLEESSQLLKDLLPRMIEDLLKLTVDVVFPKNSKKKRPARSKSPSKIQKIPSNQLTTSPAKQYADDKNTPERTESRDSIRENEEKAKKRIHPVHGYQDNINMWEKLWNVEKHVNGPTPEHKHTNNRHKYAIFVQDKIFKIKKNPSYIKTNKPNEVIIAKAQELTAVEIIKPVKEKEK